MKSERALSTMVEAGSVSKRDTVLEIGPGMGALTEKLLATGCKIVAVEKDDGLYEFLKEKFAEEIKEGRLELINDDILNLEFKNYKIVANIPYNITGAILKKFLGAKYQPKLMVLLVQKEVAQRIVARVLTPSVNKGKESILSISIKAYGTPSYIETVKAGSFAPMPSVDSAIIKIENISKEFFKGFSEENFFEALRAGFKSKRKKLSSNLSTIFPKNKVIEIFQKLNLGENIRAEDIGIETWGKIISSLYQPYP